MSALPVAHRRNILDLAKNDPDELRRFATALNNLRKNNTQELYAVNAIHGGGFPAQYEKNIKPMVDWYLNELGSNGLSHPDAGWAGNAFCSHSISLFLIWHRPYMRCYELLLQKNDPEQGRNGPLALHYWAWDEEVGKPLPSLFTDKDYFGKGMENPFVSGPIPDYVMGTDYNDSEDQVNYFKAFRGKDGNTIRGDKYTSIPRVTAAEVYNSFNEALKYYQVSTTNGVTNHINFEDPHNALHNHVGGAMSDPGTASWDPIFYLHHSNVERMQYAYIKMMDGKVPDYILDDDGDRTKKIDINSHLYPFPNRATFTREGAGALPWVRTPSQSNLSTAREWFDNTNLGYDYDKVERKDFGPRTSARLVAMAIKGASNKDAIMQIFVIKHVKARGPGVVKGQIKIGDVPIDLADKYMFSFSKGTACANCEARVLTLSWALFLTPELAAASTITRSIQNTTVVSLTFNGEDISEGITAGWYNGSDDRINEVRLAIQTIAAEASKSKVVQKVVKTARKVLKKIVPDKKKTKK